MNRLIQVSQTGLTTQTYGYDGQGERISKTIGANTNYYLYNGMHILEEYANTLTSTPTQYTHGPRLDEIAIKQTATESQYYHQDGLNSLVAITNATGTTDATQRFNAWGEINASTGEAQYFGYTGREKDETGLMYYRARYYAPDLGRFTQQDPIGLMGGLNAYAYVNNSPAMFNDPMGKDCKSNKNAGTTTCTPPYDGAPSVTFLTPPRFPDTITSDSTNYHDYNVQVTANNVDPNLLRQGIVNNPTPGNPSAATTDGTLNDATPTNISNAYDTVDYVSSFGNDPGGYNNSPVQSYIRTDNIGNSIVVNVTEPGHPLFPGYVVRTVTVTGDGRIVVNNYGEGTNWRQAEWNPMKYPIKWAWIGQTQRIIDGIKGGGFVIYAGVP